MPLVRFLDKTVTISECRTSVSLDISNLLLTCHQTLAPYKRAERRMKTSRGTGNRAVDYHESEKGKIFHQLIWPHVSDVVESLMTALFQIYC